MSESDEQLVDELIVRVREAQERFAAGADQARFDRAADAAAWALMHPARNQELSELAVSTTGLGNVADKVRKNHRKTLGLLADLKGLATQGIISEDSETGIIEIARPIGVIGAVVPSTNPAATPVNNVVNALKCGNAIILSPSPAGVRVCERLLHYIHAEFARLELDPLLVQMLPAPSSKAKTQRLMEAVDLIIVTGSQDNVRRAYRSGTPALGVGAGNATVIIDETADLDAAASRIAASKTFDNATSCSSENVLIVVESVRDAFVKALHRHGGRLLDAESTQALKRALFQNGHLNRHLIARDIDKFLDVAGIEVADAESARFVLMPATGVGPEYPESGEKLSLAVALYTASNFDAAQELAARVLKHQGAGHSVGLHSIDESRAIQLGEKLPTCRVIVNQAHCFATGGSFENGLPFSLSMGCGSWGGNSIDNNLHYRHFMNITKIVKPIAARQPVIEELLSDYWALAGR